MYNYANDMNVDFNYMNDNMFCVCWSTVYAEYVTTPAMKYYTIGEIY